MNNMQINIMKTQTQTTQIIFDCFNDFNKTISYNEFVQIEDIELVNNLFSRLSNVVDLGISLYNSFSSGLVKSVVLNNNHIIITADDVLSLYIFKFKSLIVFISDKVSFSPIFIFESTTDTINTSNIPNYFDGVIKISKDLNIQNNSELLNELMNELSISSSIIEDYSIFRFINRKIMCFLNINELEYGQFEYIIQHYQDSDVDAFISEMKNLVKIKD